MLEDEKEYLVKKLKEIRYYKITISKHLMLKDTNLLTFNKQDVINVLRSKDLKSLIIEYNETPLNDGTTDFRVLLRDDNVKRVEFRTPENKRFEADANLCFVISLKSFKIITVYWNIVDDNHYSINWDRYDADLKIIYD